jgi:hypothetical protein
MYKVSTKWMVALAAIVGLLMPATALPAQSSQPCANVSVSIAPAVVERGGTVMISASISNCSSKGQIYTIRYELTTPCTSAVMFSVPIILRGGQTLSVSNVPLTVPSFACPGNYTVTVKVFSRSTLLSSSSASLTVL